MVRGDERGVVAQGDPRRTHAFEPAGESPSQIWPTGMSTNCAVTIAVSVTMATAMAVDPTARQRVRDVLA